MDTFSRKALRITPVAAAFGSIVSGDDVESISEDIVADVLHWCSGRGGRAEYVIRMALSHFEEESPTVQGDGVSGESAGSLRFADIGRGGTGVPAAATSIWASDATNALDAYFGSFRRGDAS